MNESELQRNYIYNLCPNNSKIKTTEVFVNIDKGGMGGSQWTCFMIKDRKILLI